MGGLTLAQLLEQVNAHVHDDLKVRAAAAGHAAQGLHEGWRFVSRSNLPLSLTVALPLLSLSLPLLPNPPQQGPQPSTQSVSYKWLAREYAIPMDDAKR